MLTKPVPDLDAELDELFEIGSSGYMLALNYTVFGPEYMRCGHPAGWQAEYEENHYYIGDPVLIWIMTRSGVERWSGIKVPDARHVMRKARAVGLNYGVAISARTGRKRSFLTVARADRGMNDGEIAHLVDKFRSWCNSPTDRVALTDRELDVLRLLRDGLSQRDIAETLGIVEATVKQRAIGATRKLGAANRIQAVAMALERRLFD